MSVNSKNTSTEVRKETSVVAPETNTGLITNAMLEQKTVIPLLQQLREAIDALQTAVDAAKNEASCKQMTPSAEAVIKKGEEAVKAIRKANITENNASSHTRNIQKLTNAIRSKCKKGQEAASSPMMVPQQPRTTTTTTYMYTQMPPPPPQMPQQPSLSSEEEEKQRKEDAKSKDHMESGKTYNYNDLPSTSFDMILPLYKEYLKGDKKSTFGSFIDAKRGASDLSVLDKKTVNKLYEEYETFSMIAGQDFQYSPSGGPLFSTYIDDRYTYKLENDPTLKAQTGGAKKRSRKTRKHKSKRSSLSGKRSKKTRKH